MKITKDSWHYRLLTVFGGLAPYEVPRNLCPYVRRVVFTFAVGLFCSGLGAFLLFVGTLPALSLWLGAVPMQHDGWAAFLVIGGVVNAFLICIGFLKAMEATEDSRRTVAVAVRSKLPAPAKVPHGDGKPREPSLLAAWIKAKHDKVCPSLDFE